MRLVHKLLYLVLINLQSCNQKRVRVQCRIKCFMSELEKEFLEKRSFCSNSNITIQCKYKTG